MMMIIGQIIGVVTVNLWGLVKGRDTGEIVLSVFVVNGREISWGVGDDHWPRRLLTWWTFPMVEGYADDSWWFWFTWSSYPRPPHVRIKPSRSNKAQMYFRRRNTVKFTVRMTINWDTDEWFGQDDSITQNKWNLLVYIGWLLICLQSKQLLQSSPIFIQLTQLVFMCLIFMMMVLSSLSSLSSSSWLYQIPAVTTVEWAARADGSEGTIQSEL